MVRIHKSSGMLAIIVIAALAATETEASTAARLKYYARTSKDLRSLAQMDLETVTKLQNFSLNHEAWPSKLSVAVDE